MASLGLRPIHLQPPPYIGGNHLQRADTWGRPYGVPGSRSFLSQGPDTGRPAEGFLPFRSPPSSAPFGGTFPLGGGKAFGRLIVVPAVYPEAILSLSQGPGPDRPAKYREIPGIRREGHTPGWPHLGLRAAAFRRLASKCACGRDLAPAGQFTFSPSPTNRKKTLRVWVGEPLGTPAGGKPRGHPHPPPLGAPSPLEGGGLGPVRIRTGSVSSAKSGAVLESQRF